MKTLLEKLVLRLGKHSSFNLDEHLSSGDIARMIFQMGIWFIRGLWVRLKIKKSRGLVLAGARVRIRYGRHMVAGKNLVIEEGAEIMALSLEGILIGDNVTIGAMSSIKPSSYYGRNIGVGLKIGNNSNIGRYSYIGCSGGIEIGENVMISPRVSMYSENHDFAATGMPMKNQGVTRKKIVIEDDCWIAANSVILAGVTVATGSVIAAGTVVTQDVPPFSIVGGVPGKVISSRLPATETNSP